MNQFGGAPEMNEFAIMTSYKMMQTVMSGCFNDCVTDFRSQDMSANEKQCLNNCASRSTKTIQLMGEL